MVCGACAKSRSNFTSLAPVQAVMYQLSRPFQHIPSQLPSVVVASVVTVESRRLNVLMGALFPQFTKTSRWLAWSYSIPLGLCTRFCAITLNALEAGRTRYRRLLPKSVTKRLKNPSVVMPLRKVTPRSSEKTSLPVSRSKPFTCPPQLA